MYKSFRHCVYSPSRDVLTLAEFSKARRKCLWGVYTSAGLRQCAVALKDKYASISRLAIDNDQLTEAAQLLCRYVFIVIELQKLTINFKID